PEDDPGAVDGLPGHPRPAEARAAAATETWRCRGIVTPSPLHAYVGSGFPPSLRFGEARRSAKRGGGSRIGRNPPKGGRHRGFFTRPSALPAGPPSPASMDCIRSLYFPSTFRPSTLCMGEAMINARDSVISITLSESEWQEFVLRQPQP